MNNAFYISARDVRMISAPRKLKSVMYELTTSITSLPEALYVLRIFLARSHPKLSKLSLFVSAGYKSVYNSSNTDTLGFIK
jgi:hypothetical protein